MQLTTFFDLYAHPERSEGSQDAAFKMSLLVKSKKLEVKSYLT